MYAVVYKNRVIVGPMDWNSGIFKGSLEKEGVDIQLSKLPPEQLPLIINNDAKITLVEEIRPEIDPMVEYYYGPLWNVSGDVTIANYEVMDSPVDAAKINYINLAAAERWKKEVAGVKLNIGSKEVTLDTTRDGRAIYSHQLSVMSNGDTVNWKFTEGWLSLTKSDMSSVVAAVSAHVQSTFDWEKNINDQTDAANTKQELQALEIIEQS
jgi:hypothetical protein